MYFDGSLTRLRAFVVGKKVKNMGSCYLRSGTKSWLWATPRFAILVLASVGWLAGCGGGGSDGAPAPVVTMPPEPERVNLSISKIGADQGVLTAHIGSEAIGSCGLNCAELSLHVPIGALLRLEAQATTGASLWSWGSLPCRTHETRCEFEMVEDRAPDVTFTRVTVTSNVFAIPASFESSVIDPQTGVGITVPENAALVPTTFRLVVHTNELSERNFFVEIPNPEDWTAGLHMFRLESPQPVSKANLETSAFVIRSLSASLGLDAVLIPPSGRDAWFVEYDIASSVSVGARDKAINRVATDFCPYGVNAHQEIIEIGCYQKIAALATPRCGVDGTIAVCPHHRQPVIFIHGYQLKDGFKDIFEIQKNEPEKVWSEFPEILHHEGYAPYLFRWNTAQRFEDAARSLREVVDEVRSIHADAPPLIVAHSFGGLVARAYLHGADSVEVSVPGPEEVLGLITVGTPHSGIATGGVFEFEGRKVRLPMGIDPDGRYRGVYDFALINSSFVVDQCEQISCYLAGRFIDIFSPRDRDLNPIPSLDMKAVFGVDSFPGGTIYRVNYGGSPMQVPLYALLGLQKEKGFGATNTAELKEGDGLISWQGQRIHPIMSCGSVGCENRPIPAAISMPEVFQGKITERVLGIAGDLTSSVVPGASVDWRSTEYRHSLGNQTWYSDGGRVQNVALVGVHTDLDQHEVLIEIKKVLVRFSDPLMNFELTEKALCEEYGVCGVDFALQEGLSWAHVRLSVEWGDGSTMNEGTVSGCIAAGYCSVLSDGTLRVWHSLVPGTYEAVFTYAYGQGPEREARLPVMVERVQELTLVARAGDGRAVLDWPSLGAGRHNLCRAQVPVPDFDSCNVIGGQPIELNVGMQPLVIVGLANEQTYYFRVEAEFGPLRLLSNEVSVTPVGDAPPPVSGRLNDTGITWSGHASSGNAAFCDPAHPAGQDCHYGRDAQAAAGTLVKVGGGNAGFDYTKIANNGSVLPASATLGSGPNDWACTRDNVTGLIWEVKLNNSAHLRHEGHFYTWFNSSSPDGNPGSVGYSNECSNTLGGQNCNTENYVAAVNAQGLCGSSDWRMPTRRELQGIVDYGRSVPSIDAEYFPNTGSDLWSDSPCADSSDRAWSVSLFHGHSYCDPRNNGFRVRLVRGGE